MYKTYQAWTCKEDGTDSTYTEWKGTSAAEFRKVVQDNGRKIEGDIIKK